jgi:endoglucanase
MGDRFPICRRMGIRLRRNRALAFVATLIVAGAPGACVTSSQAASPLLRESWLTYARRFIQADGRVIDHKGGGISTSEGQAYAMLRAAWIDDRRTFDAVYAWGRNNLNSQVRSDRLWAWKWGQSPSGRWEVMDRAFATDADQDVALALLMAHQQWRDERYLHDARATLADLWRLGTVEVQGTRILLAGDTLCKGTICRINPSYFAPYAYRIFATTDPERGWLALVDSSYRILARVSELTSTRLPADWVLLNKETGAITRSSADDSNFSYDAFRVFWRVALDRDLSRDPRANQYLRDSLSWMTSRWRAAGAIPAVISPTGRPLAAYEAPEMLAALMPAWRKVEPEIANAIDRKLQTAYRAGIWFDERSYYIQNWAWFGTALDDGYLAPFRALQ